MLLKIVVVCVTILCSIKFYLEQFLYPLRRLLKPKVILTLAV